MIRNITLDTKCAQHAKTLTGYGPPKIAPKYIFMTAGLRVNLSTERPLSRLRLWCKALALHCILKDAFSCIQWDNSLVQAVGHLRTLKAMLPSKQGYELLKGRKKTFLLHAYREAGCQSRKDCARHTAFTMARLTVHAAWWLALLPTVVHGFSSADHLTSHIIGGSSYIISVAEVTGGHLLCDSNPWPSMNFYDFQESTRPQDFHTRQVPFTNWLWKSLFLSDKNPI